MKPVGEGHPTDFDSHPPPERTPTVDIPANHSEALDAFLALPMDLPLRPSSDYLDKLLALEAGGYTPWTTTSYDPDDNR
jgi:hypothetical protein